MMNTCVNCQAQNPSDYQFCQYCGNKMLAIAIEEVILGKDRPTNHPKDYQKDLHLVKQLNSIDQPSALKNPLEENLPEIDLSINNFADPMELSTTTIPYQNFRIADLEIDDLEIDDFEVIKHEVSKDKISFNHDLALIDQPNDELPTIITKRALKTNISAVTKIVVPPEVYLQSIAYAGKTDVGKQRDRNEDDFITIFQTRNIDGKSQISDRSDRGLFVLCDGMGGHEGGEIASAIAVNSISEQFRPFWIDTLPGERTLTEIISNANQAIFTKNESEQRLSLGRMGTTMVMLAIHDLDVMIAHVGDSRIYKVTNNPIRSNQQKFPPTNPEYLSETAKLEQITRDHEVLNQLLDLGLDLESAQSRPDAHQLTQAMGPHPSDILDPDIKSFSLTESTLFLLCSDGLCDNDAIEQNWETHLLPILNRQIDIQTGVDNLIELGNKVNGHDNLTVILVLCVVLIK
jgi:serine/threonine protein phosphatase PrpC